MKRSLRIDRMNSKNGSLNRRKKDKTIMNQIKTIVKTKEDLVFLIKYTTS
jgi:hypothetical protein